MDASEMYHDLDSMTPLVDNEAIHRREDHRREANDARNVSGILLGVRWRLITNERTNE